MKKYLVLFLISILFTFPVFCQQHFAEFQLKSNNIDNIQAFELNDSVFLSYVDTYAKNGLRFKRGFWINAEGVSSEIPFNTVSEFMLCGVAKSKDGIFFYFLGKDGEGHSLKIQKQVSNVSKLVISPQVTINGDLVVSKVLNKEMTIISYEKKLQAIRLLRILGDSVIYNRSFPMPVDLSKHLKYSAGLLSNTHLNNVAQGSGRLKFYMEDQMLVISIDEFFLYDYQGKSTPIKKEHGKSTILKIDLKEGSHKLYEIGAPDDYKFSSYYYRDQLFRFIMSAKMFHILVYDLQGKVLYDRKIAQEKSLHEQVVYFRNTSRKKVEYGTLLDMMQRSFDWQPSLLVSSVDSSTLRLVIGGLYDLKDHGIVSGFPNPLVMLGAFLISHAIFQLQEAPGMTKYLYLNGNLEKGFDFEPIGKNQKTTVQVVIDEFEISRDTDVKKSADQWFLYLLYKGYIELDDGALGIYQEKRGRDKKLILLKYKSPEMN